MNKSEKRELAKCVAYYNTMERLPVTDEKGRELLLGILARSMGTLVRSARSFKAREELLEQAERMQVRWHHEFIMVQWEAA